MAETSTELRSKYSVRKKDTLLTFKQIVQHNRKNKLVQMGGKRREMTHSKRSSVPTVLLVAMATVSLVLAVFTKPCSSLVLFQSFQNSSLWRERYLNRSPVGQPEEEQLPDYYNILGVGRTASKDDIKTAFRQLVKQYHPDANPDTDTTTQFQTINKAYQILSDPQKRKKYNAQTYHHGMSSDTPHFIIDALESDFEYPEPKNTANTDTVRYQPIQIKPNNNGRGSLLNKDEEDDDDGNNKYRIRSFM